MKKTTLRDCPETKPSAESGRAMARGETLFVPVVIRAIRQRCGRSP